MTVPSSIEVRRSREWNPWLIFVARRAVGLAAVLVVLAFASFLLVRLIPGDPAAIIAGPDAREGEIAEIREQLGLDHPLPEQFIAYLGQLTRADLGMSFRSRTPVTELLAQRVGSSLQLAGTALVIVLLVSVTVGIFAAALTNEGRRPGLEAGFTAIASVFGALPEFLAGTFLAFVFAVWLRLLPVAGNEGIESLLLPTVAVSLRPAAILSRIVRVETLNVLRQDYYRTARAKRLPRRLLYGRHALPNVLTAALTIGGLLFAHLIGGAVVVENVFARAGLGTALVTAVQARDFPVIQGVILLLGVIVVAVNVFVDVLLRLVDPRSLGQES